MQDAFVREVAQSFHATASRLVRRLAESPADNAARVVEDELRGLFHGVFVILDGGSALANEGLLSVVDEDGVAFDRFLHEICFAHWRR